MPMLLVVRRATCRGDPGTRAPHDTIACATQCIVGSILLPQRTCAAHSCRSCEPSRLGRELGSTRVEVASVEAERRGERTVRGPLFSRTSPPLEMPLPCELADMSVSERASFLLQISSGLGARGCVRVTRHDVVAEIRAGRPTGCAQSADELGRIVRAWSQFQSREWLVCRGRYGNGRAPNSHICRRPRCAPNAIVCMIGDLELDDDLQAAAADDEVELDAGRSVIGLAPPDFGPHPVGQAGLATAASARAPAAERGVHGAKVGGSDRGPGAASEVPQVATPAPAIAGQRFSAVDGDDAGDADAGRDLDARRARTAVKRVRMDASGACPVRDAGRPAAERERSPVQCEVAVAHSGGFVLLPRISRQHCLKCPLRERCTSMDSSPSPFDPLLQVCPPARAARVRTTA